MKPILKAPGTNYLKLQYDEPPSNFALKLNMRPYNLVPSGFTAATYDEPAHKRLLQVGRCRLTLSNPR
jgi:hypothetical protein